MTGSHHTSYEKYASQFARQNGFIIFAYMYLVRVYLYKKKCKNGENIGYNATHFCTCKSRESMQVMESEEEHANAYKQLTFRPGGWVVVSQ